MIRTVLLDLDGPLLDGKLRHYQCYADILRSYGHVPMSIDEYWAMKRVRRSGREQLAVSGAESIYDDFLEAWLNNIEKPEYLALDKVQDGVIEKIRAWHREGITIILVTMRSNRSTLKWQLETCGLLPWLSSVVVCNRANGGKGKALELLREFPGVDPARSLWVGDTEADAEAASVVGCPLCLLSCGLRDRSYLASFSPDLLLDKLREIDSEKLVRCGAK